MDPSTLCDPADWQTIKNAKRVYLQEIAQHAMAQQKHTQLPSQSIPFPSEVTDASNVKCLEQSPASLKLALNNILTPYHQPMEDVVRFALPDPINMLEGGSGLALIAETESSASREIRLGLRLIAEQDVATILPSIPIQNAWGDNPHEIYFDWAFINYENGYIRSETHRLARTASRRRRAYRFHRWTDRPNRAPRPVL